MSWSDNAGVASGGLADYSAFAGTEGADRIPSARVAISPTTHGKTMARTTRMEQIEHLLAEDPNDSFLRYGLAMEHASAGDPQTAVRLLNELISLKRETNEPYVGAYLQAGQLYVKLGKPNEAIEVLREGIVQAGKVHDDHAKSEMAGLLGTLE